MLRYVLLGLLRTEPRYGYELKAVFEHVLAGTWPLNVGQVYTTLAKLEEDGLVSWQVVPQAAAPDRKVYSITAAGEAELDAWLAAAEAVPVRLRDELFLKLVVATLTESGSARELIGRQRRLHLEALARLSDLRNDPSLHPSTVLVLEGAVLRLEADLHWLDICHERLKEIVQ